MPRFCATLMHSSMPLKQQRFDMKDTPMAKTEIRNEGMRISGEVVFTDKVVEVLYPFTD